MFPSSHQESSPCQTPRNPGLEMKQRRVCVGVCVYLWVCTCASLACLCLILTFPTGAGVNKAASHSRCGEQDWEQGRSASLQPQAAVKPSWRSQYLHSVSKPALFLYQKPGCTEASLSISPGDVRDATFNSCVGITQLSYFVELA